MVRDPVTPDLKIGEPAVLAEAVRHACVKTALAAYEDARMSGLCHEGAWECAVDILGTFDLKSTIDCEQLSEQLRARIRGR